MPLRPIPPEHDEASRLAQAYRRLRSDVDPSVAARVGAKLRETYGPASARRPQDVSPSRAIAFAARPAAQRLVVRFASDATLLTQTHHLREVVSASVTSERQRLAEQIKRAWEIHETTHGAVDREDRSAMRRAAQEVEQIRLQLTPDTVAEGHAMLRAGHIRAREVTIGRHIRQRYAPLAMFWAGPRPVETRSSTRATDAIAGTDAPPRQVYDRFTGAAAAVLLDAELDPTFADGDGMFDLAGAMQHAEQDGGFPEEYTGVIVASAASIPATLEPFCDSASVRAAVMVIEGKTAEL